MASMDQVLLGFPPDDETMLSDEQYHEAIKLHIGRLNQLFRDPFPEMLSSAAQLFQILDPAVNSLSTLALINALKTAENTSVPVSRSELTQHVINFLQSFDGRQIRYVGDLYTSLLDEVIMGKWVPGPQAVGLIAGAILRLDPTGEMLTTAHCSLANLAWESGHFDPVLPVIERPYVFVPGMASQPTVELPGDRTASPASYITPRSRLTGTLTRDVVINYDYTCGLIFSALRRWNDAHAAYSRIVTFATRDGSITPFMAKAYKRWLLTGLLALGRTPQLPSYVHPGATKQYNAVGKPYQEIASLFSSFNVEQLRADTDKLAKAWEEDENTALVAEVMAGCQKWQIVRLSDVYCKVSIREIREQTKSAETGRHLPTDQEVLALVQTMIDSGMLRGSLGPHPDGTTCLTFLARGDELTEREFATRMKEGVDRLKILGQVVQTTNARLMASKDYVKHVAREQKRSEKDSTNLLDAGYGFDQSIEDEDLMVDVTHQG